MPIDASIPLSGQQVNPMQPLSSLLNAANGVQQYRIGQQTLQQQQLNTQQAQQIQNERSAINQLFSDPNSGIRNPDGTVNISEAMKRLPTIAPQTWAQYGANAATTMKAANDFIQSKMALGQESASRVGNIMRAAVGQDGKPRMSLSDINANLSQLEEANPDNPALRDYINHARKMLLNTSDNPGALNSVLGSMADTSVGNGALRQSQQSDTVMLNNGRASIPVNAQPGNGPVGQATGVPTLNQLGPGQSVQLMTGPDGNAYQVVRDPTTGTVKSTSAIGGQGGAPGVPGSSGQGGGAPMPHYAPGQMADTQAAQQETQQVRQAASQVATNRHITDTLLDLTATAKDLGPNSDKWAHAFGTLGMAFNANMPETDKYQQINAYLDRMALQSAQSMGLSTDAARSMAANAVGTTQMGRDALREKVRFVDAMNTGLEAYRMGLDRAVGTGSNQNFAAKRQFDSQWAQNADPLVFRLRNAQQRGDKEDYQATLARIRSMPEAQRNAVLAHANAINQLVNGGQQ